MLLKRKELTKDVRGTLYALFMSGVAVVFMSLVVIGGCIGAIIGAVALPLKILDGRVIDAPEGIKNVFTTNKDEI